MHVYRALVLLLVSSAHVHLVFSEINEPRKGALLDSDVQEELYKKSFVKRRREHLEAAKNLQKTASYERLYKMIIILADKMITVIEKSKDILAGAEFNPSSSPFPLDPKVREALTAVLENTALFGDIILHIPHITHRILNAQPKLNTTMYWSLNFTNQTRHLLDNGTITMIRLVAQELNIIERDSNYFNPYWQTPNGHSQSEDALKKKKSKKEKLKKGPQIIKIEF